MSDGRTGTPTAVLDSYRRSGAGGPIEFSFALLGPVRAWGPDGEVDLGSPQQRSTLAVLLLHQGAVATVDELIRAVWGDEAPRAAVTTIRTYVSRLRRVLEPTPDSPTGVRIRSMGGGYALQVPPDSVDVIRFHRYTASAAAATRRGDSAAAATRLRAALALPNGSPLAGVSGPYAHGQRVRLQQLVLNAEIDLIHAQIDIGRHHDVLPELSMLVTEHPLWERVHELFMTALYRSGRQADALAHYQTARRDLVEHLGIEPSAALRDLHQRILTGEVAIGPATPWAVNRARSTTHRAGANRMRRLVRR
ncbi:AfsR/SARP family transcriptional regulator [Micromonospora sp. WMMD1082]|uniref:AfsR/SARP family transcriptional regulator n=1 Tax=Micromonospora sp. WMMD1082 TaxID=3016104 RepID=UPI0024175518|nr:AfsR/SARP family transcriptional regulator [Micromonospora sp. WMMD1082]MDG4795744.1 AfsR/SARP family transcriptional regulator [Micromonospora sp. WMMD1082]